MELVHLALSAQNIFLKILSKKMIVYSRDENKQYLMEKEINHPRLRFF